MSEIYNLKIVPAIRIMLIAGFFVFSASVFCQDSTGLKFYNLADEQFQQKRYDQSWMNFRKAQDLFFESNDWNNWKLAYSRLRKIAQYTKNRSATVDSLKNIYQVVPEEQWDLRRHCHGSRAFNLTKLGMEIESLEEYKMAYEILIQNNPSDTVRSMSYLRSIAYNYSALGDQITSIKFINDALDLAKESGNRKHLCKLFAAKANALFHDDKNDESLAVYLSIIKECGEGVLNYCKIAQIHLFKNQPDSTVLYLDKALDLIKSEDLDEWEYDRYLSYKSEYLAFQKSFAESIRIKEGLIEKRKNDTNTRQYIKDLVQLAQLQGDAGHLEDMISNVHLALTIHYPEMDSIDLFSRPQQLGGVPDIWVIEALYLKANYFKNMYEKEGANLALREEASFYFELMFEYFDRLKSSYENNLSKYRIGDHTRPYYEGIVRFFADQFDLVPSDSMFNKAFEFSQQANAYVLKNAFTELEALDIGGISQDSMDRFTKLRYRSQNEQDPTTVLEFKNFKSGLAKKYNYFKYENNNAVISVNEVQHKLSEGEVLLKYFYTEKELFIFSLTKNSENIDRVVLPEEFDSLVNRHQYLISQSHTWDEEEYKALSFDLYSLIMPNSLISAELKNDVNRIIVVPDGPLKKISFSSLIKNDVENFIEASDYLISDVEVSYLYYVAQLRNLNTENRNGKGDFISFGIEYEDEFLEEIVENFKNEVGESKDTRSLSLSKLDFADNEARRIARMLGGDFLVNNQVTKSEVEAKMKNYNMLHFSTHAFVDMSDYLNSYIVFYKDSVDGYKMTYRDILNMNLNSDFVVLSACQTANGKDYTGESLMSLARAFVQSGCSSTMSSYWNASDRSTMEIMELFYNNFSNGSSKSASLRNAQLAYLTNDDISVPSTRSPFYWSSWAIYGENSKIKNGFVKKYFSSNYLVYSIGALLTLILSFMVFKIYRAPKSKSK